MMDRDAIARRHDAGPGHLHRCHGPSGPAWYPYEGRPCDAARLLDLLDTAERATRLLQDNWPKTIPAPMDVPHEVV
jgi:hypothetical protein